MSAFSDFLTHATAPWWSALAGTLVGGAITASITRASDNRKDRQAAAADIRKFEQQRIQRQDEDVAKLCARLLADSDSLRNVAENELRHQPITSLIEKGPSGERSSNDEQWTRWAARLFLPNRDPGEAHARMGEVMEWLKPLRLTVSELSLHAPAQIVDSANELIGAIYNLVFGGPFARSMWELDQLFAQYEVARHAFMSGVRGEIHPALDRLRPPPSTRGGPPGGPSKRKSATERDNSTPESGKPQHGGD